MDKNEFDVDFDFEKEYGFDPKAFLGNEEYDEHIDLTAFSDEELGLNAKAAPKQEEEDLEEASDFDLDADLKDFLTMGAPDFSVSDEEEEEDSYILPEPAVQDEDILPDDDYFRQDLTQPAEDDYDQEEAPAYDREDQDNPFFEDEPGFDYEEEEDEDEEDAQRPRKTFTMPKLPKIVLPKIKTPNIFTKFYDLYFAPVLNKEAFVEPPTDPNNPRRRRRKSKAQIFKEVYLPPIIVCVTLILVMTFCIGSLSNVIADKRLEAQKEQSQLASSVNAEALKEQEYIRVMEEAAELAAGYNYAAAITTLDTFGDMTDYPDMSAKRAEYVNAQNQLVPHSEPALIPNLSFHCLIVDPARAFSDKSLGGSYNKNFTTVDEFKAILNQLYNNGYVLVDFDSIVSEQENVDGTKQYFPNPVYLPADKKPIMITETMANYFEYMLDGQGDGIADGFATRLVVQGGEIKAEYTDKDGNTSIGDYDLVPILESFIEEHPDFSYQGARATVAVTGSQGVFGYRTNTSYISSKSQTYYDEQVAGAKEVVATLRDKGYTIACFTYDNKPYGEMSAAQITADLTSWANQITPVVGEVDTLIFARTSSINDYNGTLFNVLYTSGFRYFVSNGSKPWAEVNTKYVRQNRLMVGGNSMAWHSDWFTGIFDCAAVLDVNSRGNVPN